MPEQLPIYRSQQSAPGALILFVDDERQISELVQDILEGYGFRCVALTDSLQALALFKKLRGEIDALVTDQNMPGLTGIQLIVEIRKENPELPVVMCTGFSNIMSPEKARQAGINEFLYKPFSPSQLVDALRRAINSPKNPLAA